MNVRRVASTGSALIVAGIAAYASYSHMRHLAIQYGQDRSVAALLPISVDGMLVVATIALGDGRRYRWSAWAAFWLGVTVSVVANALAAQPSFLARCISAWPAVAFLATVEVITRAGRRTPAPQPVPAERPEGVPAAAVAPVMFVEPAAVVVNEPAGTPGGDEPEPHSIPEPVPAVSNGKRRPPVPDRRILARLRDPEAVPRRDDGTVPVRLVEDLFNVGQQRAERLLREAGLYRAGEDEGVPAVEPQPVPINGREIDYVS